MIKGGQSVGICGIRQQWIYERPSPHHIRDKLPSLLNQSAAHGSLLLVQCLIQSLPHHHQLFLGFLLELLHLVCRQIAPSGGESLPSLVQLLFQVAYNW